MWPHGIAIEQASTFGWERRVGALGLIIGMETFTSLLKRASETEPDHWELLGKSHGRLRTRCLDTDGIRRGGIA